MKQMIFAASVFAAGAIFAAENAIEVKTAADLAGAQAPVVTQGDGFVSIAGRTTHLLSNKAIDIKADKSYKLTGFFRTAPNAAAPSRFYFGVAPLNAKGQMINPMYVKVMPGTDTTLTEAAGKGSKTVKVKDAAKWDVRAKYRLIVFNTRSDFSDLPNRNIGPFVAKVEKKEGFWEITLHKPLTRDYPAGTAVRQHSDGGTFMYAAAGNNKPTTPEWTEFSATIKGVAKNGNPSQVWWPGTGKARIVLFTAGSSAGMQFKDLKLQEL